MDHPNIPYALLAVAATPVVLSLFLVVRFTHFKTTPLAVMFVVFVSWTLAFSVPVLLAFELSCAGYENCLETSDQSGCVQPHLYRTRGFRRWVWRGVYWQVFFWCWLLIPFLQGYVYASEFGFLEKCRRSWRVNAQYYGFMFICGVCFMAYIGFAQQMTFRGLFDFCFAASNAYMTAVLSLFVGYGLLALPRAILYESDAGQCVRHEAVKISWLRAQVKSAKKELQNQKDLLLRYADEVEDNHEWRKHIDAMFKNFHEDFSREFETYCAPSRLGLKSNSSTSGSFRGQEFNSGVPSFVLQPLPNIFGKKNTDQDHLRNDYESDSLASTEPTTPTPFFNSNNSSSKTNTNNKRFYTNNSNTNSTNSFVPGQEEEVANQTQRGFLGFVSRLFLRVSGLVRSSSGGGLSYQKLVELNGNLRWWTMVLRKRRCILNSALSRALRLQSRLQIANDKYNRDCNAFKSRFLLAMRFVTLKFMFLFTSILSLVILWSELSSVLPFNLSPFGIISRSQLDSTASMLCTILLFAYISWCVYRTLFNVNVYDYVHIVRFRMTDPYSLLFVAGYSCRIVIPTCYHVLSIMHVTSTEFSKLLGTGSTKELVGERWANAWCPLLIVLVACATMLDCCCLGVSKPPKFATEEEGLELMQRVRSKGPIRPLSRPLSPRIC